MVDALSNDPGVEGGVMELEAPTPLPAEEKIKQEKASTKDCPADQLNIFITRGGSKEAYRQLLITLYGKKLIERTFPQEWKGAFLREHCIEILQKIGSSLTLDDLEEFYAELKSGKITSEILKYAQISYLRMWWAGSVKNLPPYWMNHLIALFRDPLKEMNLKVDPENISLIDAGSTLYTYYTHALKHLKKKGDRSRPEFFYASRELLARFIAYANPKSVFGGAILPVFNQELGREVIYTLKGQLHNNGLHAYLFVPIEKRDVLPAQLIFRGTQDYESIGRGLDAQGVGKQAFAENTDKIEALIKAEKISRVEIIGHSLGASDAQRAVALLVDPLKNFEMKDISLFAFCSPRLEIERVQQWVSDLQILVEKNRLPAIYLNFAYHENDAVTWTGDNYLSGAVLDCIYTNYLVIKSKSGVLQTPAHHITPFFVDGNFNFDVDGRHFVHMYSFPNTKLSAELQKLEEIKNVWQWWRDIKSYFVKVSSKEEVEKQIEEMKQYQDKISAMEKGGSQHSWIIYSGWRTVRSTIQPLVYYTIQGLCTLGKWKAAYSLKKENASEESNETVFNREQGVIQANGTVLHK